MNARRAALHGVAAMSLLTATTLLQAGPSHALGQPSQTIQNRGNQLCMDLKSYDEHTAVTMYRCTDNASAKWRWHTDGSIQNVGGDLCMDVRRYAEFTPVTTYRCNDRDSSKWDLLGDGTIHNRGVNMCMDLTSYDEHTPVTLARCTTHDSAKWSRG
ncbi:MULTISPECIES: RICIN domain-containing protein [unclassified Streptomyces]|uniref:RICIN domain-containing protein n=1 Tax=unclassified Streptomyces TaxID=2593676 RepID=UPI003254F325